MSATCRGCGKRIIWGVTSEGKRIPLDPAPPVYEVIGITGDETYVGRRAAAGRATPADGTLGFAVSHFSTCTKANDFSGARKP